MWVESLLLSTDHKRKIQKCKVNFLLLPNDNKKFLTKHKKCRAGKRVHKTVTHSRPCQKQEKKRGRRASLAKIPKNPQMGIIAKNEEMNRFT